MKFIKFLQESIPKISGYKKEISEEEADEYIAKFCDYDTEIYRGINSNSDNLILSSTNTVRKSTGTNNFHTIIMDHLIDTVPEYKEFPKRSESIIATNSKNVAVDYGSRVYYVYPEKGVKIAYSEKSDIWLSKLRVGKYETNIVELSDTFEFLGHNDKTFEGFVASVKSAIIEEDRRLGDNPIEHEFDKFDGFAGGGVSIMRYSFVEYVSRYKELAYPNLIIFGRNENKIEETLKEIFDFKKMGIKLTTANHLKDISWRSEIWFKGQAIAKH